MRKKSLLILYALIFFALCGCKKNDCVTQSENPLEIGNSNYRNLQSVWLDSADTLLTFDDCFPVGVNLYGNSIVIKTAKSDSCILVFDKSTLTLKWQTGAFGLGPHDVINPEFYANICQNDSLFQMIDVSDKSSLYLDIPGRILSKKTLPDYIGWSSSVNVFDQFVVGALNTEECMFYIFDKNNMHMQSIKSEINCGDGVRRKVGQNIGYLISCLVFANEEKNTIIVPHYFFDVYSIYDFSGKLLKKICLSKESLNEERIAEQVIDNESYIGYVSGFVAGDAYFFNRSFFSSQESGVHSQQLLKVGWDGTPLKAYYCDSRIIGQFCIDDDRFLYAIVNDANSDEENFYLLRWRL